ncbi:MAG: helicase-related protein [Erysipelotrichia bacterium]|nr:helicase-related protein [Erysipelotrichia bacterium]
MRFLCRSLPVEEIKEVDSEYHLSFSLTERQKEIADKLDDLIKKQESVLLEAVCGAGKTEIVYQTISSALKQHKRVGFAISRRQVVLEIAQRLQSVFTSLKVTAVCQGYTQQLHGDLIVCTTHQLYRYYQYFDLLIIDEPDAFPFKGNDVLQGIAYNACRGQFIYLTATPDKYLTDEVRKGRLKYLYLSKRPSGRNLPVPQVIYQNKLVLIMCLIYWLKRIKDKPILVFVPTIKWGNVLYLLFCRFFNCVSINSTSADKEEKIEGFRNGDYHICFSTTVLERGITIKNVNVIVFLANHAVFDEASLVQSSGRVGRSITDPDGKCIFLAEAKTAEIDNCIKRIRLANEN